jgi:hypothetical protein
MADLAHPDIGGAKPFGRLLQACAAHLLREVTNGRVLLERAVQGFVTILEAIRCAAT